MQTAVPARPIAECTLPGEFGTRVYQIVDRGSQQPRWWLTLGSTVLGSRRVELPLADARVERSSASRNGGLAVGIDANADKSTVDVFVNFELEVNVWRDLSPDVVHMNTNGPQTSARCRVLPSPAR
jgi:hypothetical protein